MAGQPSFEVEGEDYVTVSVDSLTALPVSGPGAQKVKEAIAEALSGKPAGTRARIMLGTFTEGSSRWQVTYLKTIVLLDGQGRPDGEENHITNQSIDGVTGYRTIPWKHGIRDGVEKVFLDGRLREELPWKNGKMEGRRQSFFADGKVEVETQYTGDLAEGPTRIYGSDGSLIREGTMKQGQRDGVMTEYWPGTKRPKRVATYRDGQVTGAVKEYYLSGRIKREVSMKDEAYDGEDKLYNEDGKVSQTRYWRNGDLVTKEEFEGKGTP
jgi:antitoxin component YwqK of YwqJK toxin-antitoxin module